MSLRQASLQLLNAELVVEVARSAAVIEEAQKLRHQVYYLEKRFFNAVPGSSRDHDVFDEDATHIVVRRTVDGDVVATSRVVRARPAVDGPKLPMFEFCSPTLCSDLPLDTVGEISRFAISKQARGAGTSSPAIRLLLLRGILQASRSLGLTHWCALMEPSLIRLLSMTGLQFSPLGPAVDVYGMRQPSVAVIDSAVSCGRLSHPWIYEAVATEELAEAA